MWRYRIHALHLKVDQLEHLLQLIVEESSDIRSVAVSLSERKRVMLHNHLLREDHLATNDVRAFHRKGIGQARHLDSILGSTQAILGAELLLVTSEASSRA